jgi:hypothetical protein
MANQPIRPGFGIINHSVTRRTQHYPTLAEVYVLLLDIGNQLDRVERKLHEQEKQRRAGNSGSTNE